MGRRLKRLTKRCFDNAMAESVDSFNRPNTRVLATTE
jgi:hypothetical protein